MVFYRAYTIKESFSYIMLHCAISSKYVFIDSSGVQSVTVNYGDTFHLTHQDEIKVKFCSLRTPFEKQMVDLLDSGLPLQKSTLT